MRRSPFGKREGSGEGNLVAKKVEEFPTMKELKVTKKSKRNAQRAKGEKENQTLELSSTYKGRPCSANCRGKRTPYKKR